jgi:RNA polymerase sigma-70 factor (sigma-E family)
MMAPRTRSSRTGGPPLALTRFVEEQYPQVEGALVLYTGDRARAQELTQETFARVCQHWDRVERMDAPGPWVHRVAMNLAHSAHRRRGAERRATERAVARGEGADRPAPDAPLELTELVRAALLGLPERERAVVVLRFYADLSVDETAAALGIPSGTVKTTTRRAMATLRDSGLLTEVSVDE